jgi:hypothetical protein
VKAYSFQIKCVQMADLPRDSRQKVKPLVSSKGEVPSFPCNFARHFDWRWKLVGPQNCGQEFIKLATQEHLKRFQVGPKEHFDYSRPPMPPNEAYSIAKIEIV